MKLLFLFFALLFVFANSKPYQIITLDGDVKTGAWVQCDTYWPLALGASTNISIGGDAQTFTFTLGLKDENTLEYIGRGIKMQVSDHFCLEYRSCCDVRRDDCTSRCGTPSQESERELASQRRSVDLS